MGEQKNFITPIHQKSSRSYLSYMNHEKVQCMKIARQYGQDFWDGDRKYGYGGYRYIENRWTPVAKSLIETYNLVADSRLLDIGCGKGFLLHDLLLLEPRLQVVGSDISSYAIENSTELVRPYLINFDARDRFSWSENEFDLAISINVFHNFEVHEIEACLKQFQRIAKSHYLVVESYRDEQELFNLQCWAKTCETFFKPNEWIWLFERAGYQGDYEFIYFE